MKYDATNIPEVYDAGRSLAEQVMTRWMAVVAARLEGATVGAVLDLGCGTGRFSAALATQCRAPVIGVDPSRRMLARARAKRRADGMVQCAAGSGESLPLRAESVDVVFMSMVFHHFEDPHRVARECHRVLRGGGWALVRTGIRERIARYAYVPFFPASVELLRERLPSRAEVAAPFEAAGFRAAGGDVVTQEIAPSYSAYAEKIALGGDSVLADLGAEAFAAGLDALRRHAAGSRGAVTEPIDLFSFRKGRTSRSTVKNAG